MAHKYLVDLTSEEQGYLLDVIRKGKTTARRVARASPFKVLQNILYNITIFG